MLYHTKLGLPKSLKLPIGRRKLILTNHAKDQARSDRYGDITPWLNLHNSFDPGSAELVEIETDDKIEVKKAVYRMPLSPKDDNELVLAVVPYSYGYVAKTVWINKKNDRHNTLNVRRYARP